MKIRKAIQKDFKEYLNLKKYRKEDYLISFGKELISPIDSIFKKEFYSILHSRKSLLIVAEEKSKLIGYIQGVLFSKQSLQKIFFNSLCTKMGYVGDIFVLKEFRRKGVATFLINEFVRNLKNRKYEEICLLVNKKNKNATNFYDKLDFKISRYEMKKKI